jgi:hypothetical protein
MPDEPTPGELLRQVVGVELTHEEASALADWYANLARMVAAFPGGDLKQVEPPLRSTPAPRV